MMITKYGLSKLGPIYINTNSSDNSISSYFVKNKSKYSQSTKKLIDSEIKKIVLEQMNYSKTILLNNREK